MKKNTKQGPRLRDRISHGEVGTLEPWYFLLVTAALALAECRMQQQAHLVVLPEVMKVTQKKGIY